MLSHLVRKVAILPALPVVRVLPRRALHFPGFAFDIELVFGIEDSAHLLQLPLGKGDGGGDDGGASAGGGGDGGDRSESGLVPMDLNVPLRFSHEVGVPRTTEACPFA